MSTALSRVRNVQDAKQINPLLGRIDWSHWLIALKKIARRIGKQILSVQQT